MIYLTVDDFPEYMHTGIVGRAKWAHLSTSHKAQIKPEPALVTCAEPITPYPAMQYVFSRCNIYLNWQNQTEK